MTQFTMKRWNKRQNNDTIHNEIQKGMLRSVPAQQNTFKWINMIC